MAIKDKNLTIKEAQEYLALNGIDWTLGTIKMYIHWGKIPSIKILNSRAIPQEELAKIVEEKRKG